MTQHTEPLPPHLAEPTKLGTEISVTGKWTPTKQGGLFRKTAESTGMLQEWEDIHAGAKSDPGVLSTEINHAVGEDAVLVHHVAFFSLMSHQLASKEGPTDSNPSFGPFHWATGGRATIETVLPLDLETPLMPGQAEDAVEEPGPEAEETEETAPPATDATEKEQVEEEMVDEEPVEEEAVEDEQVLAAEDPQETSPSGILLLVGVSIGILIVAVLFFTLRKRTSR